MSFDQFTLAHGDARATLYPYGAHVTSWIPNAATGERLYLSGRSAYRDGAPIRGGVPVIFPQFADTGPLPKHGFARTRAWEVVRLTESTATLRLRDDDATRAIWPHAFVAEVHVELRAAELSIALAVENAGREPFSFTGALHTYFRVDDVAECAVEGLDGVTFRDSVAGGVERVQDGAVRFAGEVDRVYVGVPNAVTLREPRRATVVGADGFSDVVVWNPGATKGDALADLDAEGWRRFVCIEAAVVAQPVRLAGGERWVGTQRMTVG